MASRRALLAAAIPAVAGIVVNNSWNHARAQGQSSFEQKLAELEKKSGGRLGVALLDTATGTQAGHRRDEQFPMCSTFKLLAVAAVLARADRHEEQLDRIIHVQQSELMAYSPITKTRVGNQGMSVKELCAAAMTMSDNTATNLLIASIGGPAGFTSFARTLGDNQTRLDRIEPDLNEGIPGDPRDTTTPQSMLSDLNKLVLGNALSPSSRTLFNEWLIENKTGDKRLRAGLPSTWKIGDKTGSGDHGTTNDVAIAWPPGRQPILAAVYLTGSSLNSDRREQIVAEVGRVIATAVQT